MKFRLPKFFETVGLSGQKRYLAVSADQGETWQIMPHSSHKSGSHGPWCTSGKERWSKRFLRSLSKSLTPWRRPSLHSVPSMETVLNAYRSWAVQLYQTGHRPLLRDLQHWTRILEASAEGDWSRWQLVLQSAKRHWH